MKKILLVLIVLGVLAILVAVAIPVYRQAKIKEAKKEAKENFDIAVKYVRYVQTEMPKGNKRFSAADVVTVLNKGNKKSPCTPTAPAFAVAGLILIPQYPGQVVISDFGDYYQAITINGDDCTSNIPSIAYSVFLRVK